MTVTTLEGHRFEDIIPVVPFRGNYDTFPAVSFSTTEPYEALKHGLERFRMSFTERNGLLRANSRCGGDSFGFIHAGGKVYGKVGALETKTDKLRTTWTLYTCEEGSQRKNRIRARWTTDNSPSQWETSLEIMRRLW